MIESLKTLIPKLEGKKILIVGDVMLDEHIWSKVARISPEAPVPVADVTNITHVPGGAGNVAANVAGLKGIPYLIGAIGEDSSGSKLMRALERLGISRKYLIRLKERPTILKSRIIAAGQQVVRVDREERSPLPQKIEAKILRLARSLIKNMDAVIISDYGKGMVTERISKAIIKLANLRKKPVCIDPKGKDYSKYAGATVITPNIAEAELASRVHIINDRTLASAGGALISLARVKNVLLTRGKDGMSLFEGKSKITRIPVIPREVFDITGAGDTVIGTLALALSAKAPLIQAAMLSNWAASIVVSKIGTAPVRAEELEAQFEAGAHTNPKIQALHSLKEIVKKLRGEGAKIVFTNGCFDLLHLGHINYLREAKKLGDVLIVGLNSDSSVKKLKGAARPLLPVQDRSQILASLEFVDYVTIFSDADPCRLLKELRPDIDVKGGDYSKKAMPEAKIVRSYGGKIIIAKKVPGRSTSSIIRKIIERS